MYIRKRGCKCPDKKKCKCDATYSFSLDVGRDPVTGKRKQRTVSGFTTKKAAELAYAEMTTDFERGNLAIKGENDTVGKFMKEYLETTLRNEIKQNTYEGKLAIMNNHVIPKIGNLKLQKVTPLDLQKFINSLMDEGFSAGTVRNIMRLVNQTFRTAAEWGYITKNVTVYAKKPNYKAEKHTVWTKAEWDTFLESSRDSRFYPFYLIMLNTGMRPGEVLALSWEDINFKQKMVRVSKTVVNSKAAGIQIKPSPKNDASNRNITLPDFVIAYLKKYKLEQVPNNLNLVIPGIKSEIVYNSTINKAIKEDAKKAGVPIITPHELRHTHATFLLSPKPFGLGISTTAVSERLGHATSTVTMNTYAHVLVNMQEAVADALDEMTTLTTKK